jgi:hypothetical protein
VTVTNVTFTGGNGQAGRFTGLNLASGGETLQLDDGVMLTSGLAVNAVSHFGWGYNSYGWLAAGDADLSALIGKPTYDANTLTVEFTAEAGTNRSRLV